MKARAAWQANPVMVKEFRSRMRGVRAFAILTATLLLLALASYLLYRTVLLTAGYGGMPLSPQVGQAIFAGLAFLELVAICFLTPALTAGAISGERESQTYEMLLSTPLPPASILRGKLVSALGYVFLLIFASVPLASLAFTFGGITPRDLIKVPLVLLTVAVTVGVIGVFFSAWLQRTARATVLTYLLVLLVFFGSGAAYAFAGVLRQEVPPRWILVVNPASALFSALTPSIPGTNPVGVLGSLGMVLGGNLAYMDGAASTSTGIPRPLYHYSLVLYAAVALVLYLLATRLVKPVRRWRFTRSELLGAVALLLLLGGGAALAFGTTADRYEWADLPAVTTLASIPAFAAPVRVLEKSAVMAVPAPTSPEIGAAVPVVTLAPLPTPTGTPAASALAITPLLSLAAEDKRSQAEMAALYAAVVRQLLTVDSAFSDRLGASSGTGDGGTSPAGGLSDPHH